MKVLIIAATQQEMPDSQSFNDIHKHQCEFLITGVGTPVTILKLTEKLSKASYDLIINIGIAGAFHSSLQIGDVVQVKKDRFADLGVEEFEQYKDLNGLGFQNESTDWLNSTYDYLSTSRMVTAITVNTVTGSEETITKWQGLFNPDIETMEGAAVFFCAHQFGIACLQLRAISNLVGDRNKQNWNISLAVKNLNLSLKNFIEQL